MPFRKGYQMITDDELQNHWVVQPMASKWQLNATKHRIIETILFIRKILGKEVDHMFVVDVGDTDGLLIRKLGCKGVGINIVKECVENIKANNVPGLVGDVQNLTLKSKSVDYAFCFETIEHVENPLLALKELERVSRKGVFVAIPFTLETRVRKAGYSLIDTKENQHIFEFCERDFINLLTHTNLVISAKKYIYTKPAVGMFNIIQCFFRRKSWILFFLKPRQQYKSQMQQIYYY